MTSYRWEKEETGQCYEAHIMRDTRGQWSVIRVWGPVGFPSGRTRTEKCASLSVAEKQLKKISEKLESRGYVQVKYSPA